MPASVSRELRVRILRGAPEYVHTKTEGIHMGRDDLHTSGNECDS